MAYSFRYINPKYAGTIVQERVRCGKKNCRCKDGQHPHQGNYLYWRDYRNGGKLRKTYIPKSEVEGIQRAIAAIKAKDNEERSLLHKHLDLMAQIKKWH